MEKGEPKPPFKLPTAIAAMVCVTSTYAIAADAVTVPSVNGCCADTTIRTANHSNALNV